MCIDVYGLSLLLVVCCLYVVCWSVVVGRWSSLFVVRWLSFVVRCGLLLFVACCALFLDCCLLCVVCCLVCVVGWS